MITKEQIIEKCGTYRKFIDWESTRILGAKPFPLVDTEIRDLLLLLSYNGLHTMSSCSGHGKTEAHIHFDSYVTMKDLSILLNANLPFVLRNKVYTEYEGTKFSTLYLEFDGARAAEFKAALLKNGIKEEQL